MSEEAGRTRLDVRVTPRAGRNEIAGFRDDGTLLVRVTAPPDGGRANDAVRRVIAKSAGVPPTSVTIVRGLKSRDKTVELAAVGAERLAAGFGASGD